MKIGPKSYQMSRHLPDSSLLPPENACCLCSSSQRSPLCLLQKNPDVTLLECTGCGAASASRIPTRAALDDYYREYYQSPRAARHGHHVTCDSTERFGRHLATRLRKHTDCSGKTSLRILDFGGGDGAIAAETARCLLEDGLQRAELTIVDYNKTLFDANNPRIALTRHDTLQEVTQAGFDFVLASAILEHLPRPKETLVSLLGMLNAGGVFYARTPYVVPFIKLFKCFGVKWDFLFPAHIHDLGQGFWNSCVGSVVSPEAFSVLESRPSIVETSFRRHFLTTLAAYAFKAPWYVLRRRYGLVGGWEVLLCKQPGASPRSQQASSGQGAGQQHSKPPRGPRHGRRAPTA